MTAGTLPPGLTLSSAGVISGTATTAGDYTGTVTATNGITPNATQTFNITIADAAVSLIITSAAPGNGTQGAAYSHTYTATGTAPITFAVTAGTLPPGLTLSSAGVISGTATTAGTYVGTVTATNGTAPNATQNFSITIAAVTVPPSITSAAPGNGTQGAAYSHTYTATGTSPITFAVTAGALPPGLTLSSAGVISGTATTAGTYVGTVTATNGITPNATQNFSITISAATVPPTITSAAPANGTQGVAYSHTYTATGSGTISYVVSNGTLPPGLTLTTAGVLSGTPTTAGTYTGRVRASNGTSPNATQNFRIIIAAPSVPPTITSAPPPNGTQGVVYSHSYTVTGSGTISYVVSAGALPPGLNLSANGVLSGTPTTAGVYSGVVTASNGTAPNATQSFSITIAAAAVAPSITSLPPVNSTQNSNYLHTYTATGSGTITFTLTSGELPPGLSLSANGVLSGTPNILDEYTGVVTASNGIAPDATQPFSIAIVNSNTPGSGPSLTTLFAHDNRQFSGNMFDVTITNPLRITSFDMNVGWGTTTISVYYRNGSYVGSETNPAAWTLMSSAAVLGEGPNNRTRVAVSSPVLQPGVYGFYVTTIPNFDVMTATDLHYSVGGRTVANDDLSITTGNGVGGMFGDPAACAHPTRAYFLDPCIFPDRTWNGTIYYELSGSGVSSVTSVAPTADAPSITSGSPASGTEAVAYAHSYTATGSGTISYVVSAGELPPGLTLSADGLLSGTPTAAGEYSGEVTASNGTAPDATQPFTITIASAAVAPSITSGAPASGTEGVAYAHSYTATGSGTISYVVSAGTLPPGLALSADGVLSGTPTAGEYSGEVTASNGIAPDATQPFTITIAAAAVAPGITSGAPANGTEGVAYAHSYTATGSGTISYAVSAGELPPGLALSADGVLSGTPTAAGEYSGEVTASSGTAPDATQPFTITIAVPE